MPTGAHVVEAILGVDFGTRFTKVAVYLPHIDERVVLAFGPLLAPFIPSRLALGADGLVYPVDVEPETQVATWIDLLKMRLADPSSDVFGTVGNLSGVPFKDAIRGLSAAYLAGVLRQAESAVRRIFAQELPPGTHIEWSANFGIPAARFNSDTHVTFQEVAGIAWTWRESRPEPLRVSQLLAQYDRALAGLSPRDLPIRVAPELVASLAHFGEHRNTKAGLYGFFDIGGGTLDGTMFQLHRAGDRAFFDILSAEVEELGTMAIARRAAAEIFQRIDDVIETPIILGGATPNTEIPISMEIEDSIRALVKRVADGAFRIMPREPVGSDADRPVPRFRGIRRAARMPAVPIFIAGGGAQSEWYRNVLERTHQIFDHAAWGISGFKLGLIPPPPGVPRQEYARFMVAVGLTSEHLHSVSFRLPGGFMSPQRVPAHPTGQPGGHAADLA